MNTKKCCAHVQCTVDKRWMHTKKVALKDGCAQKIDALLYNVLDKKYGWTKKVALVYNALNEQDGCKEKCCANVPWIKHGCTLEIMHSRTLYLLLIAGWSMNTKMDLKGPQS